ncbi:MAG TPA: tetratricopeptide repeat protein [Pyrinomonadaceae bacterium]|jgi:predicted Zn-dependent protease/TolB-like protein|nr:tetratricopeptide repeat protein [Pyrinomonadaceae bacterium]
MFKRFAATLLAFLAVFAALPPSAAAAPPQSVSDVVLILPFENTSGLKDFNWVGESFADQLADLLGSHGLRVISSDARELTYQRLHLPLTVIPSRATSIKLAREAGATMVVLGTYEVTPARDEKSVPEIRGSARIVRVNEGRIAGKQMPDGRWATHEFFFGDALLNLQTVQGKLAYQILYEQDDKLPFSQNAIVEQATKVPPRAFEAWVKATMTKSRETRLGYLTNAMREYEKANPGSVYKEAAFELGQHFYSQTPPDYKKSAEYFSMLQRRDPHYAEATFYAALAYWRAGELQSALDALLPLTTDMPLTSIYNNAGALSTQAALKEKNPSKREALLKQATNFLSRAAESVPDDSPDAAMVRYNYAYALMLSGKFSDAAEQLRTVVKLNPHDPEAHFLFAKMLEKIGQTDAAAANDDEARKLFPGYGKAQIEWQQSQTTSLLPIHMRGDFNIADYVSWKNDQDAQSDKPAPGTSAEDLLAKARELYDAGRDDEALTELRDVVRIEPMNAEAYLMTGRIYQRRGELASAINQLKTSIFWDTDHKLIDAHILLGRIFLERGDRAQATAYAQSAMQIDPNNQEAIALQRQLQAGIK